MGKDGPTHNLRERVVNSTWGVKTRYCFPKEMWIRRFVLYWEGEVSENLGGWVSISRLFLLGCLPCKPHEGICSGCRLEGFQFFCFRLRDFNQCSLDVVPFVEIFVVSSVDVPMWWYNLLSLGRTWFEKSNNVVNFFLMTKESTPL